MSVVDVPIVHKPPVLFTHNDYNVNSNNNNSDSNKSSATVQPRTSLCTNEEGVVCSGSTCNADNPSQ
eukprot:gene18266-37115_t